MTTDSQEPAGQQPASTYPARVTIDYVDDNRNRLTVFFRILLVIPIAIVVGGIAGDYWGWGYEGSQDNNWNTQVGFTLGGISLLFWPVLLMILFRQKYPRWWFEFNLQLVRFSTRIGAYVGLLTDEYPSTDEEQGVHLEIDYPDASQLNRWLPLIKWFLAIPHYIVLILLFLAAIVIVVVGWFIILFTGKFPRGFHDFLVGVTRWALRVEVYVLLLTTDEYPPFSLD